MITQAAVIRLQVECYRLILEVYESSPKHRSSNRFHEEGRCSSSNHEKRLYNILGKTLVIFIGLSSLGTKM